MDDWRDCIHVVTAWCVLSSIIKRRHRSPHLSLLAGADRDSDVGQLRKASNAYADFLPTTSPSLLEHAHPFLLRLLTPLVDHSTADPSKIPSSSLRRCRERLSALRRVGPQFDSDSDSTWYIGVLETIWQTYGPHDGAIRLITFEQACSYGMVTEDQDNQLCEAHSIPSRSLANYLSSTSAFSKGRMTSVCRAALLLDYFNNFDNASESCLSMFVLTSVNFLPAPQWAFDSDSPTPSTIGSMIRWSAQQKPFRAARSAVTFTGVTMLRMRDG